MKYWICKYSLGIESKLKKIRKSFKICDRKFNKSYFKFYIDWLNKSIFMGWWNYSNTNHGWWIDYPLFYFQLNPCIFEVFNKTIIDKEND